MKGDTARLAIEALEAEVECCQSQLRRARTYIRKWNEILERQNDALASTDSYGDESLPSDGENHRENQKGNPRK